MRRCSEIADDGTPVDKSRVLHAEIMTERGSVIVPPNGVSCTLARGQTAVARLLSQQHTLGCKELVHGRRELVRVLKQKAVVRVRVDDELCVGDVTALRYEFTVRTRDVVVAVGHKGRLRDSGQALRACSCQGWRSPLTVRCSWMN